MPLEYIHQHKLAGFSKADNAKPHPFIILVAAIPAFLLTKQMH